MKNHFGRSRGGGRGVGYDISISTMDDAFVNFLQVVLCLELNSSFDCLKCQRFQKLMFLKDIRLGKSNSGQQFSKEGRSSHPWKSLSFFIYLIIKRNLNLLMRDFPLLLIVGKFVKRVLNHVTKNRLLQIFESAQKHVEIEFVHDCLSILSTFAQALRCYSPMPYFNFFFH